MVLKNSKKNTALKERRRRTESLLKIVLVLLLLWLLLCLTLSYFYLKERTPGNLELNRSGAVSPSAKDNTKFYFELLEASKKNSDVHSSTAATPETPHDQRLRDEFHPSMKSLFRERELSRENIESLFINRRPLETNPVHSTNGKEVVYIYHSHSREAFLPYLKNTEKPEEAYHSKANITLVGKMLGEALERRGIGTQVDASDIGKELDARELNYGSSYQVSGERVRTAQMENIELEIFLDIHRDSLRKDSTTIKMGSTRYARLLFVVGTGHTSYEKNLAFAEGLHEQLSVQYPGLSKGILEKNSLQGEGVYNQNLSPNALIVEIGGVDNTAEELRRSVEALAEVLSENYWHGEK